MDQNFKIVFGSITQEPLGYLTFDVMFEFLRQFYCKMHVLFIKKSVDNFEIEHSTKRANLGVGGAVSP